MTIALYIIGSTFALLVVAHKLREARRELKRVTWQRDHYAQWLQESSPRDDYVLPAAVVKAGHPDGRPGQ
jgi:hypothetical protein